MVKKSSGQDTPLKLAHKACAEGFDFSNLINDYFSQLSALFEAIKKIDGKEYSTVYQLSELGRYLCDDWSNNADLCRESLEEHFNAFHEVLYPLESSNG